jgi:transposase
MGKPHPIELRERVVAFVDEGHTHRAAARHFRVSPRFVNDMIKLRRETKALSPKPQGNGGRGKLEACADWVRAFLARHDTATLDEIRSALEAEKGVNVHRASIGSWLHRLGLSHKKNAARQ